MATRRRKKGGASWLSALLVLAAAVIMLWRAGGGRVDDAAAPVASSIPTPAEVIAAQSPRDETGMELTVLEVGKADCLVLQCDGESMIIDGGNEADEAYILSQLEQMDIEKFKYLVNTHPHEDHLGSLDAIVRAYPVDKAYLSPKEHTTSSYENLLVALEECEVPVEIPQPGDVWQLGGAAITVLSPDPDADYDGYNDWSIVLMAQYGEVRYLLMGDAETPVESDLLDGDADLRADVLKLGHHGSNTSSKKSFLSAVNPTWVLITCDRTEKAGEPNEKVAQRLADLNIPYLRTDLCGIISVYTDGTDLAVQTEREEP